VPATETIIDTSYVMDRDRLGAEREDYEAGDFVVKTGFNKINKPMLRIEVEGQQVELIGTEVLLLHERLGQWLKDNNVEPLP
jgi:hypothetical protein